MKQRIIQLIARYIGAALLFFAGIASADGNVDPSTAESLSSNAIEIATAVVGCLALLLDLVIHRLTHGSVISDPNAAKTPSR